MDEKKIIEQLQNDTKDIRVPDNLLPENIMSTISDTRQKKKVISFKNVRSGVTKKLAGLVSAAAVVIVAVFAYEGIMSGQEKSSTNDVMMESAGMEMNAEATDSYVIAQTGNISGYDEVYKEFEKYKSPQPTWFERIFGWGTKKETNDVVYEESVMMEPAAGGAMTDGVSVNGSIDMDKTAMQEERVEMAEPKEDYSKTNVQTVGIDEADIIKTDGKYIYYASKKEHTITIYSVDGKNTEEIKTLYMEELGRLDEFYIDGDMLLATGISYRDEGYQVTLVKYDITDRKNPKSVGIFTQEGDSIETRKIGNVVYVVTKVYGDADKAKKDKPETFIPTVCDELIRVDDIFIPEESKGTVYTVISSVDVTNDVERIDSAAILGFGGTFYMGNESMYLYRSVNRNTEVRRIDYVKENGLIGEITEGMVPGVVKDTFAVNEYNGYIRCMTTSYPEYSNNESVNNVFVMNQEMEIVGSVEGLAQGERIYSARYMGDTAYFVTYRETDPLYSVDLSDPKNPKIMGALKIPGFSEYLHGYGDGLLLGIGIEQLQNEKGWMDDYIKLSMFDISNPYDVTEEDKTILHDAHYSVALYDYKAVMIDADKNIFGFVTEDYYSNTPVYRIFTYTEAGFVEIVSHNLDYTTMDTTRSVFIGDYVYVVNEDGITVYSIK